MTKIIGNGEIPLLWRKLFAAPTGPPSQDGTSVQWYSAMVPLVSGELPFADLTISVPSTSILGDPLSGASLKMVACRCSIVFRLSRYPQRNIFHQPATELIPSRHHNTRCSFALTKCPSIFFDLIHLLHKLLCGSQLFHNFKREHAATDKCRATWQLFFLTNSKSLATQQSAYEPHTTEVVIPGALG